MSQQLVATSKFLSLVLRHRSEVIGIELDAEGWVAVEDLLTACAKHGRAITREQLDTVVRMNNKQRFAFSADGSRIRANQGHSLQIDLGLVPVVAELQTVWQPVRFAVTSVSLIWRGEPPHDVFQAAATVPLGSEGRR